MPQLGDRCYGYNLGFKNRDIYIWEECPRCHEQRWASKDKARNRNHTGLCRSCHVKNYGNNHPNWKGGRSIDVTGYSRIILPPGDFFASMAYKSRSVLEHRLVMAKSLGRNLHSWEIVHHKNHIKTDNRIENLQLISLDKHTQITRMEQKIKSLEALVTQLKAENTLLKKPVLIADNIS